MRNYLLLLLAIVSATTMNAQTTIAVQSFDGATPTWIYSTSTGATYTGNSASGDRPASNAFYTSASTSYGVSNNTAAITFNNITGLSGYTSKYVEFRLASWSIGSVGNGTDAGDYVLTEVSLDGGSTYTSEAQVNGNNNAYWSFTTGTGTASTTYTGSGTATAFTPGGGGARTADGYSTVHINLPNSCTQARIRITLLNNSTSERWTIDDVVLKGTLAAPCSPGAAPTTSSSSVNATPTCTSSAFSFTAGNGNSRMVVLGTSPISTNPSNGTAYTASAAYGAGSAIGSAFVVYNGTGNSLTIVGLTAGTTYYYRVYEYNFTSANCDESYQASGYAGSSFTTLTGCVSSTPNIHDILADACGSAEGTDELVMFTNGTSPLSINTISIAFPSGGTYCNTSCTSNTLVNNASFVSSLNTTAGCTVFAYADPIPASAEVVVFCGNPPSAVLDYSYLCSSGQLYYVIFCNNTSTSGRFANSGTGTRTLTMDFNGTPESVTYAPNSLLGDGSFVNFDDVGNPTYYSNPACVFPLGVELTSLTSETKDRSTELYWSTASENNAHYFSVQRAGENGLFTEIGKVSCYGNSQVTQHYHYSDEAPLNGISYYRLRQFDYDGKSTYSQVISVQRNGNSEIVFYNNALQVLIFPEDLLERTSVEIISTSGALSRSIPIALRINTAPADNLVAGIYFIRYTTVNGSVKIAKVLVY